MCSAKSGCHDVMLGRGLIAQPDLALHIQSLNKGLPLPDKLSWPTILDLLLNQLEQARIHYRQKHIGNPIKQWLRYLKRNYPQAAILLEKIKRIKDADLIHEALVQETLEQETRVQEILEQESLSRREDHAA